MNGYRPSRAKSGSYPLPGTASLGNMIDPWITLLSKKSYTTLVLWTDPIPALSFPTSSPHQWGISTVGFEYQLLQLQPRYSKHDCAQGVLEPNFIEHDLRKSRKRMVSHPTQAHWWETRAHRKCLNKISKFTLTPWSTSGICNRNAVILWGLCNTMQRNAVIYKIWAYISFLSWKTSKSLRGTILPLMQNIHKNGRLPTLEILPDSSKPSSPGHACPSRLFEPSICVRFGSRKQNQGSFSLRFSSPVTIQHNSYP